MTTGSRTVAAIDCGTNAVRLLVADVDAGGALCERHRLMRIVRLGEGVDRTGTFSAAALERTFAALDEYAGVIRDADVDVTRFVATSASRDVANRAAFAAGVRARLGVEPEVISGEEEAGLSYLGAVRGLPAGGPSLPALVVDIGGGSTEFVIGGVGGVGGVGVLAAASVDIGCVRMTERHLHGDPPTSAEIADAQRDVDAAIAGAGLIVPFGDAATFVGLAGSVTTVAAMAMGLDRYDPDVLHGAVVTTADVAEATARLLAMARAERAALPFMHPGRVDVIGAGAMILASALRAGGYASVTVSETDILDGIAYRLAPS